MTDTNEIYLSAVPAANTIVQSDLEVRQSQVAVVVENVSSLSTNNSVVTFELQTPLDPQLARELVDKGYSVSRSSKWTCTNGCNSESHQVTVSLPNNQSMFSRIPRFTFPPRFW